MMSGGAVGRVGSTRARSNWRRESARELRMRRAAKSKMKLDGDEIKKGS